MSDPGPGEVPVPTVMLDDLNQDFGAARIAAELTPKPDTIYLIETDRMLPGQQEALSKAIYHSTGGKVFFLLVPWGMIQSMDRFTPEQLKVVQKAFNETVEMALAAHEAHPFKTPEECAKEDAERAHAPDAP